jgi:hypothetical protein
MWVFALVAGCAAMLAVIFLIAKSNELREKNTRFDIIVDQWHDSQRRIKRLQDELKTSKAQVTALRTRLTKNQLLDEENERRLAEYKKEQSKPLRRLVRLPKPQESK